MTTVGINLCHGCVHRMPDQHFGGWSPRCPAFPEGIPTKYAAGSEGHLTVVDGQEGDYVFEPRGEMGAWVLEAWTSIQPESGT